MNISRKTDGSWTGTGGTGVSSFNGRSGAITLTGADIKGASGGIVADTVYAKDFGAVFDGNSHPLSNYYATLAAAQAVYPKATALTNEIDGIAVQAAIDFCCARSTAATDWSGGGTVILPYGIGLMNTPLAIHAPCVSLWSRGQGVQTFSNYGGPQASAASKLRWTGPSAAAGGPVTYMLTVAPTDGQRGLTGCNVEGIVFNCNDVIGVSGVLIMSTRWSRFNFGVIEARSITYPGTVFTAGSQTVTVSSTANIQQGHTITSPSMTPGAYVAKVIDGVTIQASAQASANSTETMLIAGECVRTDCVTGLIDVNDCMLNDYWLQCTQLNGPAGTFGPLCVFGGTGGGASPSGTHYGNTCSSRFHYLSCNSASGVAVVFNNSDHNYIEMLNVYASGGSTIGLLCNGSLDPNNGSARYHRFEIAEAASMQFMGTETGGFNQAAAGNQILDTDLGSVSFITHVGTGCTLSVDTSTYRYLNVPYNANYPIVPYPADSTVMGGNPRGSFAVDLQTARNDPTQVASGQGASLSGGADNIASGLDSSVGGGLLNVASGQYACVPGGATNTASQSYSVGLGNGAVADLYGVVSHSCGKISSGKQSQFNTQVLRANSAANTTPVRLTADGGAASAVNCVNHTAGSMQVDNIAVMLAAVDSTNGANRYTWTQYGMLARTGAPASGTIYAPGTPTILSAGNGATAAVTEAADTTNGGYSLTFTPPTGNTAIWRVVATVRWTRVDG